VLGGDTPPHHWSSVLGGVRWGPNCYIFSVL
jgi:hypothetical protein